MEEDKLREAWEGLENLISNIEVDIKSELREIKDLLKYHKPKKWKKAK